jgi:PKD repeat protein
MKQICTLFFLLLFVHFTISQESEPNDTPAQAQTLIFDSDLFGNISTVDQNDWFRFELNQAGLFEIDIRKASGNIIFWVYIHDGEMENEPVINQIRMFNEDTLYTLKHQLLDGTYFIHIGTATTSIPYQLSPRFTPTFWPDDQEPNNEISIANPIEPNDEVTGTLAYYGAGAGNDINDWYQLELEEAGLLEIEIQKKVLENSEFTVYLKDGEMDGNPIIDQYRMFHDDSLHTIRHKLLKGIYYIHLAGPFIPNNYRIKTSFTPPVWPDDIENNNADTLALAMEPNGVVSGTLVYYGAGEGYDDQDWYRLELNEGGLLELEIEKKVLEDSEFTVILKDAEKDGYPNIQSYRLFHGDYLHTITQDLLKGVYFIHIAGPFRANNYQISSSFTPPVWPEDMEPNGDTSLATLITFTDSITGNLRSYAAGEGYDNRDWFEFEITEEGLATFNIHKENNDAIIWMYLTDPGQEGNPVLNSIRLFVDAFNGQIKHYFMPGRYFLLLTDASRDVGYNIKTAFLPRPVADFEYQQVNNSILFKNRSSHGSSYSWDFGDGKESLATNPLHEYEDPGVFDVCLNVSNEAGAENICKQVTVKGLASVYPNTAGNTGFATITVYGGGLDSNSIISLEQNAIPIITEDTTLLIQRDGLLGRLDLRGLSEGKYDLVVENSSGNRYLLANSFTIEAGTRPNPWIEVKGRDKILYNTPSTYTVRFGNNGNNDASFVPIWLAFSEVPDLEIQFTGGVFMDFNSNVDSISVVEDQDSELVYFTTDSIFGEPFNARVYPLIIPVIPANSTQEFNIKVKTSQNLRITSWANEPIIQAINLEGREEDEAERQITCYAEILKQNFQDALDPPLSEKEDSCILDEYKEIIRAMSDLLSEDLTITTLVNFFTEGSIRKESLALHISLISNTLRKCAPRVANKEALGQHVMNVLIGQYLTDKEALRACREPREENACSTSRTTNTNKQFETCQQCGTFCPINIVEWIIKAVFSFDPNEKDQPNGYTDENYTFFRNTVPYTIHFENMASATAPAHTVKVVDTLDANVFDFSSFEFASISIGDSTFYPEKGFNKLVLDAAMNELSLIARVEGEFNNSTGELKWVFSSLDPITMEPIEDPDIGFLPPNLNNPEGQGSVSFSIDLKSNLKNDDQILNKALIYFDANDPIETNISKFTLDLALPESQVMSLDAETTDTLVLLEWAGTDDESGVRFYDVYYSKDDSEYIRWRSRTSLTSDYFKAEPESYYRFFSVAVDSVGNEEPIPVNWDTEISITTPTQEVEYYSNRLSISPNPAKDELEIKLALEEKREVEYYITNVLGVQKELVFKGQFPSGENNIHVNLGSFPSGTYFLHAVIDGILISKKFILLE